MSARRVLASYVVLVAAVVVLLTAAAYGGPGGAEFGRAWVFVLALALLTELAAWIFEGAEGLLSRRIWAWGRRNRWHGLVLSAALYAMLWHLLSGWP